MNATRQLFRSYEISTKVGELYRKRTKLAQEHFGEPLGKAYADCAKGMMEKPVAPTDAWSNWYAYATDFAQRSILFWDMLWERGNNFVEHNREGLPPLLHFDYEIVVDGMKLRRPVNYALVRIAPPKGVTVDPMAAPRGN